MSNKEDLMDLGTSSDDDIQMNVENKNQNENFKKLSKTQLKRKKRKRALHNATVEMGLVEKEYEDIVIAHPKNCSKAKKKRFKRNLNLKKAQIVRKIISSAKEATANLEQENN